MTTSLSLAHPAGSRLQGPLRSLLRFVVGFLFLCHGAQKLFGAFGGMPPNGGAVNLHSMFGAAGVIEFAGGILIMIGLFTQPVAFICSGEMAFAYFIAHAHGDLIPLVNHGELAVVYSFLFLYFAFAGGGPYSIDTMMRRGSST